MINDTYNDFDEAETEALFHKSEIWKTIVNLLLDEKEKRLAYLLFQCNLKPREILRHCPDEFNGEDEIYQLRRDIMMRIVRKFLSVDGKSPVREDPST